MNVYYVFFIQVTFFTFLTFFSTFCYFLQTLSNAKYEYAKIQQKILRENALAMIFLMILVCYVAHIAKYLTDLLKSTDFDKLHLGTVYDSVIWTFLVERPFRYIPFSYFG